MADHPIVPLPIAPLPFPGSSVSVASPEGLEARVAPSPAGSGFVEVSSTFAPRLQTAHACWLELERQDTPHGPESFTRDVPNVGEEALAHLDERGVARVGSAIQPGTILAGLVSPRGSAVLSPEEKLLRAIFGEAAGAVVDRSLRAPGGCSGEVSAAQVEDRRVRVQISWTRPLEVGDQLELDGRPAVVSAIRPLPAELAWQGGASTVRVRKRAAARDVLEARSIGPYDLQSQQPTEGRAAHGGQRVSFELASALAERAPWTAWELFTLKSDAVTARTRAYEELVKQENPGREYLIEPEAELAASRPPPGDIFSFFEVVKPSQGLRTEGSTQLVAWLRALGLGLRRGKEATAEVLPAEELRRDARRVEAGGLLSQRVFGPRRDFECECGRHKRMKDRGVVCDRCGVEVVQASVRRERFGLLELGAPCVSPVTGEPIEVLAVLPAGLREEAAPLNEAYEAVLTAQGGVGVQQAVDRLFALLRADLQELWQTRLFSKVVDYSGRAHLTVDPSLPAGSCRVPRAMLLELFAPMICGALEAAGFVSTIKSAKRMLESGRPEALRAAEAVSSGSPLLLASGRLVASRAPLPWDLPAIAVDPETARGLDAVEVAVHLPITTQAMLEWQPPRELDLTTPPHDPAGWLSAARGRDLAAAVVAAAREGARDPLTDPLLRAALACWPGAADEAALEALEAERRERCAVALRAEAEAAEAAQAATGAGLLARSVDELELSVASANAIARLGVATIGDLCQRTEAELLRGEGFGRRQLNEVKELLATLGLTLGMKP